MIDFDLQLETADILLRPVAESDLDKMRPLTRDAEMWKWFTYNLSNDDELTQWFNAALKEMRQQKRLAFTVVEKTSGQLAGSTSLGNIVLRDKRVEIGWTWIGKPFQGKGINQQSKFLLLDYCFKQGFERVEFKTDVLNTYARRAMEKMHFVEEGVLRSHTLMAHGRRRDTIFYSVLRGDWDTVKKLNNWK